MAFDSRDVARAGRQIYEPHRADLERRHLGKYVLIDIRTERFYLAESPEAAYQKAAADDAVGPFHLLRVGYRTAFRARRLREALRRYSEERRWRGLQRYGAGRARTMGLKAGAVEGAIQDFRRGR
jgi:hypothetical protein